MKKRALPILLVVAMLITALAITAMAADTPVAPNDVSEYARTELSAVLKDAQVNTTAYCPVCNDNVLWRPVDISNTNGYYFTGEHRYLTADASTTTYFRIGANSKGCFYLNGHNITVSNGNPAFENASGATMNIIGNGTETVTGVGYGNLPLYGDTLHTYGGTMNLFGGIYQKSSTDAGPIVGANQAYTLNVYNGTTIQNGVNSGNSGGNICAPVAGSSINIYGGTVTGGQANNGGNIYANGGTVTISGGSVTGGVATSQGGNIMVGSGTLNISGTAQVTGGEAKYGGGNIYLTASSTATISGGTISGGKNTSSYGGGNLCVEKSTATISGGTISGGTSNNGASIYVFSAGTVNLSGGTVTGGVASSQGGNIMASAGKLNVSGTAQITGGEAKYGGGNIYLTASSTATISGGTISGGKNTSSYGGGNLCVEKSTATISGGTISGGTSNNGGSIYIFSAGTVNLSGGEVTGGNATSGKGGNIYAEGGAVTVTSGTVSSGTATSNGGNLYTDSYTDINISGGSFTGGSATNGGSIYIENSDFTFTGGTISGGHATEKGGNICLSANSTRYATVTINDNDAGAAPAVSGGQADASGGNIYLNVYSGKTTTIEDLSLTGGSATNNGGGLYLDGSGTLNLTDVSFNGGSATNGANFYNNGLTVNISGGSFADGNATSQGGNIYSYYGNVTIKDGTQISGGYAKVDGGNIFLTYMCKCNLSAELSGGEAGRWGGSIAVENSTLNISDSTITGGYASKGGAIYTFTGTKLEITDTEISGGEATDGGNLFVADDAGTTTLTGTTISGGTATTGGNAYIHGATTFTNCEFTIEEGASGTGTQFYNDALVTLNSCTLNDGAVFADGGVTVNGGNVYYIYIRQGQLTLDGAAQVSGVNMNKYNTTYATLLVKSTFTGEATVDALASIPEALGCGKTLDSKYTADGDFTGKLILSWLDSKPWAFHDNGALVVGNARTVKEGVTSWHKDNASAVQNYNGADWLIPGSVDLPLAGGTYTVNVAGIDLNVTGTGTVTFFDTANKDFMSYGKLTVEDVTVANEFATEAPDGNTYYMVESEGKLSFHRLGIKVNGVSVRPSVAGIYYTSKWECDDLLKTKIHSFGVAVSLVHQPGAQFLDDEYCLYTQFGGGEFVSGETKTSVLITEIMKAGADNATRGTKPIYATAYVLLDNGNGITSVVDNGGVHYSLQDTMKLLDANEALYNANKEAIDAFYATWESVMSTWGFERIGKSAQTI